MVIQIRIEHANSDEKRNFLEDLFRHLMVRQRYDVTKRIRFTGTEIDLLCKHKDRSGDTALVECKTGQRVNSEDIKTFAFDLLVENRAQHGYFVHTTQLQQQAAGVRDDLLKTYSSRTTFVDPEKLVEWLIDVDYLISPPASASLGLTKTKCVLVLTPLYKSWVIVYAKATIPSHYEISSAGRDEINASCMSDVKQLLEEELKDLQELPTSKPALALNPNRSAQPETVAEIQESKEWTDLKPVGNKYFVGRKPLSDGLYRFIRDIGSSSDFPRVFFIEGKSGWGKSSLIAHLRSRSRNVKNKNSFFVLAVDTRSANTSVFVGAAMELLIRRSTEAGFLPARIGNSIKIASWFDVLADSSFKLLQDYLSQCNRTLVLVFDQFEDVFRKHELFRAFHKLMLDVTSFGGNIVVGFSWRSEINVPMDNPAYGLWQQARETAATFSVEKFDAAEVEGVLSQLRQHSRHSLPQTLKRRLQEGSQGFPWLIKKLATHCYFELGKGLSPEELVDQNLNVQSLFQKDQEGLTPEESRALKAIAKRGYDGDAFDVIEVDDQISEETVNRLLSNRLIVRTGSKYTIYWDIFRDYLVEGAPPRLAESFLLRQYPEPCVAALLVLLGGNGSVDDVCDELEISEGTALNRIRELRNVGVVTKRGDRFSVRSNIRDEITFRKVMQRRLEDHVVIQALRRLENKRIGHSEVKRALQSEHSSFSFADKTWSSYASFLISWLQYTEVGLGGRLTADSARRRRDKTGYMPQSWPDRQLEILDEIIQLGALAEVPKRGRYLKPVTDLRAWGMVDFRNGKVVPNRLGHEVSRADRSHKELLLAHAAVETSGKILMAAQSLLTYGETGFERGLTEILDNIRSRSYRDFVVKILKGWARFVVRWT